MEDKKEKKEKIALNDELLGKVSGGSALLKCKYCGGFIGCDPDVPDYLRCHCEYNNPD